MNFNPTIVSMVIRDTQGFMEPLKDPTASVARRAGEGGRRPWINADAATRRLRVGLEGHGMGRS